MEIYQFIIYFNNKEDKFYATKEQKNIINAKLNGDEKFDIKFANKEILKINPKLVQKVKIKPVVDINSVFKEKIEKFGVAY